MKDENTSEKTSSKTGPTRRNILRTTGLGLTALISGSGAAAASYGNGQHRASEHGSDLSRRKIHVQNGQVVLPIDEAEYNRKASDYLPERVQPVPYGVINNLIEDFNQEFKEGDLELRGQDEFGEISTQINTEKTTGSITPMSCNRSDVVFALRWYGAFGSIYLSHQNVSDIAALGVGGTGASKIYKYLVKKGILAGSLVSVYGMLAAGVILAVIGTLLLVDDGCGVVITAYYTPIGFSDANLSPQ